VAVRKVKVLQGHGENRRKVVLSLCDYTGNWPRPFHEAGYTVVLVDLKHGDDLLKSTAESFVRALDLHLCWNPCFIGSYKAVAVLMACPCDHFTLAGTKFWKTKDADGRTQQSVDLVRRCLAIKDYFNPEMWALENPVGRLPSLVPEIGLPWYFHPHNFALYLPESVVYSATRDDSVEKVMATNRYTKKTGIWGSAKRPEERNVEPFIYEVTARDGTIKRGSVIWAKLGGKSERTKTLRATTPMGFAAAFHLRSTSS
jgi:hypothetical protein